jgi:hypothetical protein
MLTEYEQDVYNTYLAVTRSEQNKPFTLRKDFSDFTEEDPRYRYVQKLANFFKKYPQVDKRDFFAAPYQIYKDDEFTQYGLEYYVTQKAISVYSMYTKRLQETSPDSDIQLNSIKKSLEFIIRFCHENHIPFSEYLEYKDKGSVIEAFYGHFKDKKTNIYVLLQFPRFEAKMYGLDEELKSLFFGEIPDNLTKYKIRLYKSQQAKKIIETTVKNALKILK